MENEAKMFSKNKKYNPKMKIVATTTNDNYERIFQFNVIINKNKFQFDI